MSYEGNAVHYVDQALKCKHCNKPQIFVVEVRGVEGLSCMQCFSIRIPAYLDMVESIDIRGFHDVAFKTRRETRKRARTEMTLRLRFDVMKRDFFRCVLCGSTADISPIEVDHIVPVSKGGVSDISNLRTLCERCNRGKADS